MDEITPLLTVIVVPSGWRTPGAPVVPSGKSVG
jgi:hypothetical protein